MPLHTAFSVGLYVLISIPLMAAPITWIGGPDPISGTVDIDLRGQFAHAGTWGTDQRIVLLGGNQLLFEDADAFASSTVDGASKASVSGSAEAAGASFFASTASFDYLFEGVLDGFAYQITASPQTLVLRGLTTGEDYQVQLFVSDHRVSIGGSRQQYWSDEPDPASATASATAAVFQYPANHVVGRFTADAPTQTLYIHGVDGAPTIINAYVLRRLGDSQPDPVPGEVGGLGAADFNDNGLPDLDELMVPLLAQFPSGDDSDNDGYSNQAESLAGTDPFDPTSSPMTANLSVASLALTDTNQTASATGTAASNRFTFTFRSVPGVRYRVEFAADFTAEWREITPAFTATETLTIHSYDDDALLALFPDALAPDQSALFRGTFRAQVLPSVDTDADGLEDALERYLGFDPARADSVRSASAGGDAAQFRDLLQGANPNGGQHNHAAPGVPSVAQATRFLSQAAFGPSPSGVADLLAFGPNAYEQWIDHQLTLPASTVMPYLENVLDALGTASNFSEPGYFNPNVPFGALRDNDFVVEQSNFRTALCRLALFAPDQARQRMTAALAKILVSDPVGGLGARNLGSYRDVLSANAFGRYEDLLHEVSINPSMATYLSSFGNRKADPAINRMPDENYAREIMQLFSIGLYELNMDGTFRLDHHGNRIETYTNQDVVQVARVFTGLDFKYGEGTGTFYDKWSRHPLDMVDARHDIGDATSEAVYGMREKRFLQGAFYQPPALPAFEDEPGRTGIDDIRDTCRILVNHPNCPPFISKLLIQHLVTSNPSPDYVARVASVFADDGNGVRGNLAAVYKAILLDPDARSLDVQFSPHHGRLKGGVLRVTTLAKAFEAGIASPALHDFTGVQMINGFVTMQATGETFGEDFPSVFSFYLPEFSLPGPITDAGLVSPEFQALNAQRAVLMPNLVWTGLTKGFELRTEGGAPEFTCDFEAVETSIDDVEATLDRLNEVLCHGTLGARSRDVIRATLFNVTELQPVDRARLAVYLVHTSPEAAILR